MKVLKFGSASVGSSERLQRVVEIVRRAAQTHRVVVVTSAAAGVTDTLASALEAMDQGAFSKEALAEGLWVRHHVLAAALQASVLERWTDVDGLYTDDPYKNGQARQLTRIRLEEAWAWNHAGRLGMHRQALDPLVEAEIPVHVRSTTAPEGPGTWILPAGYEPIAAVAS